MTVSTPHQPTTKESNSHALPYYLGIVAATVGLTEVVGGDLGPTALAVFASWGVFTAALRPKRELAGRAFFAACTVALLIRNYADLTAIGRFWGLVNLLILAAPFALRPLRTNRGFPFLHFWCLIQGIYVYVSFLFSKPSRNYQHTFSPEIRAQGYQTLALFSAALVGAGLLLDAALRGPRKRGESTENRKLSAKSIPRAYILMAISMFLTAVTQLARLEASLGSLTFAITCMMFGSWLVFVALWMDGNLPTVHRVTAIGFPLLWTLFLLGEGALYQTAYPGFFLLGLWMARRRRIPWSALILAVAVLLTLNAQKGEFRKDVQEGRVTGSSAQLTQDWITRARDDIDETTTEQLSASAWRFANSDLLGYITTHVPERYPHFGYEGYTSLPTVLIPRVILPDKGIFNLENEFGRRYELIARSDYSTTVNTPLHVEAYVSGGAIFMVLIAIIVGSFLTVVGRIFNATTAASQITGALLGIQVVLSNESGTLALILILPFALFLAPVLAWTCQNESESPVPIPPSARPDDD